MLVFASRYMSASRAALIGGDLYEVVQLPDSVRTIVGDVKGKGLDAVRLAAIVLGCFRESAETFPSIQEVATVLDTRLSRRLSTEDFVTAIIADFRPDGRLTVVNCGHYPPLIVRNGGTVETLVVDPALPLGLHPTPMPTSTQLQVGDRVLFYTDGLIEVRAADG